jgi:hypothetical protein
MVGGNAAKSSLMMLGGVSFSFGLVYSTRRVLGRGVNRVKLEVCVARVDEIVPGSGLYEAQAVGSNPALFAVQDRVSVAVHEDKGLVNVVVSLFPYLPTGWDAHQDDLTVATCHYLLAKERVLSCKVCYIPVEVGHCVSPFHHTTIDNLCDLNVRHLGWLRLHLSR